MAKNKYGGVNDMPTGWVKNNKKVYALWFDMLRRCYDQGQQKRSRGRSYAECSVCDRWFSLSNFYSDIQNLSGYREWKENGNMSIDKDIHGKGNKVYSPETCCFIPIAENIREMSKRTANVTLKANEAHKVKYKLSKGDSELVFDSEKEACEYLGVRQCSVSSCYRRGSKCKGYVLSRMDGDPK